MDNNYITSNEINEAEVSQYANNGFIEKISHSIQICYNHLYIIIMILTLEFIQLKY